MILLFHYGTMLFFTAPYNTSHRKIIAFIRANSVKSNVLPPLRILNPPHCEDGTLVNESSLTNDGFRKGGQYTLSLSFVENASFRSLPRIDETFNISI